MDDAENGVVDNARSADKIALKILKERCRVLQHRLAVLEKENVRLSSARTSDEPDAADSEDSLKGVVSRLRTEKTQLARHVVAVSDENKRLWSMLSNRSSMAHSAQSASRLVRSQTFTAKKADADDADVKSSLEDISLKLIDGFLMEKSELVNQYEQMVELQMDASMSEENDSDSVAELRKQTEKISEAKRMAIQQQFHLKKILNLLNNKKIEKPECPNCSSKNSPRGPTKERSDSVDTSNAKSPSESALRDRPLEIPLVGGLNINHSNMIIEAGQDDDSDATARSENTIWRPQPLAKDVVQNKNIPKVKICPMCGKIFPHLPFNEFELHVEAHFVGEEDFDSVHDNFEIIANSIGNNFN